MRKFIFSLFIAALAIFSACQNQANEPDRNAEKKASADSLEMYQASELALLMRKMYDENLALRADLKAGNLPQSFPEDWRRIHTAEATDPGEINETYRALADKYLKHIEEMTAAQDRAAAISAYNEMVATCASCHQIYCQGPLAKIRKLRISSNYLNGEAPGGSNGG